MRFYELEALCALGEQDAVMKEMKAYWGGMLKEGATSFWEKYNPEETGTQHLAMYGRPYGKSLCHAWGASPIYLLGKYYLGVKPVKEGYKEFAITPVLRDKVKELLDRAHDAGAIIYYDVNFRSTHANEAIKLMPTIIENFEYADILRGSTEDFQNMFRQPDADKVYSNHVGFYCPNFICTDADGDVRLRTKHVCKDYPVTPLKAVSTIGAGDNFNAGVVYGLLKYRVRRADLAELTEADWDAIIRCGMDFSADVCKSVSNSVSKEFAESYR